MRLIDADAFKKILSEHEMQNDKRRSFDDYACGAANAYEHASDLLDDMPTVERPHEEWIPCSERLPEEDGKYLVSMQSYVTKKLGVSTSIFVSTTKEFYPDCIAWMPLPEPYKKEGDEK